MKDSEILWELICAAFDKEPKPGGVTLRDCLGLLIRTLTGEQAAREPGAASAPEPPPRAERAEEAEGFDVTSTATAAPTSTAAPTAAPSSAAGRDGVFVVGPGPGAAEKRAICQRLIDYRASHGLGSLNAVAMASNRAVTADELRDMLEGTKYPLTKWRAVNAALEHLTRKEKKDNE